MKIEDENYVGHKGICKKCGCKLYSSDSVEAGYCAACANHYKYARKAWEDKGLAKFCIKCGTMLHAKESIESGKCDTCRRIYD